MSSAITKLPLLRLSHITVWFIVWVPTVNTVHQEYHPGHPASHVTRLNRWDHSGMDSMLEAEAHWYRLASRYPHDANVHRNRHAPQLRASALQTEERSEVRTPVETPHSFLELTELSRSHQFLRISRAQEEGLLQHHRSSRAIHHRSSRQSQSVASETEDAVDFRRSSSAVEYMVNDEVELSPPGSMMLRSMRQHLRKKFSPLNAGTAVTGLSSLSSQYVGPVGVGTVVSPSTCKLHNGQALQFVDPNNEDLKKTICHLEDESQVWVVFDTGSTNIWVASDLCRNGACVKRGRHRYNHTRSATYGWPNGGLELTVQFGTGCIKGPQAKDDFHIGPFTVFNQTFGMIETQNGTVFNEVPFEGILGLAFKTMSANGVLPFFDNIIQQKALVHNEFAFYFSPDSVTANAVFWGGVDRHFFEGKIKYFPVVDPYYWAVELVSFKIGTREFLPKDFDRASEDDEDESLWYESTQDDENIEGLSESSGIAPTTLGHKGLIGSGSKDRVWKAILDTGTTFYTAEGEMYNEIMSLLHSVKCSEMTSQSHPPLTYRLRSASGAEHDFVLSNHQYMTAAGTNPNTVCSPAFMRIDIPRKHGPGMVLGECFLRHFYAVFDRADGVMSHARVGLAKSRHDPHTIQHLMRLTNGQQYFQAPDEI